MRAALTLPIAAVIAACAAGCGVSHDEYDAQVEKATRLEREKKDDDKALADVRAKLTQAEKDAAARDDKISQLSTANHNLQASLDETTAINQQLREEVAHVGVDVDKLLKDKGALAASLDDAKKRLEELRRAQAAADARAALFRDFAQRFQSMINVGQLAIGVRNGRLAMTFPSSFLFDPGSATVREDAKGSLLVVAKQLAGVQGHEFEIGAHTDSAPPGGRFASNWDLSSARAVSLVKLFTANGVNAAALSAAAYADGDPVAPNDSPQNRAKNARVEIVLRPNVEDLVAAPTWPPPAAAPAPSH